MARLAHVAARSFVHQHDCHVLLHARYAYKMVEITFRHPLILFFVQFEIIHHRRCTPSLITIPAFLYNNISNFTQINDIFICSIKL